MLKKVFRNFDEAASFLRDERHQLYTLIVSRITDCSMLGYDKTLIAEFLLTDEDIVFKIEMSESEWYQSLHLALYYFEDVEEYEKCEEIKELIKELYG